MPPGRDTATSSDPDRRVVQIPDVLEDPGYVEDGSGAGGFRSILAVPLMRDGTPLGAISVGRPEPGLFPDTQIALLKTFADQAVIAIENVRLFTELEARTTQLTRSVGELRALGEVGQAVSSTLDLETVLSTIVSRATALAGMDGGAIYEYDEAREEFYLHATDRLPDELVTALRAGADQEGRGRARTAGDDRRASANPRHRRLTQLPEPASRDSHRLGYRSLLAVPLLRDDHLLGGSGREPQNPR